MAKDLSLTQIVADFADGLCLADARSPVSVTPRHTFKPGIGPFPEAGAIKLAITDLRLTRPGRYDNAEPMRYPGTRSICDLVIPSAWMLEFKLVRPFGDNGVEAEHWSQNLLHPYSGNISLLADRLKLVDVAFGGRRAAIVFGYEHTPARIPLEPTIRSFEVLAREVMGINLGPRCQSEFRGLVHPFHQQGVVCGWEVQKGS